MNFKRRQLIAAASSVLLGGHAMAQPSGRPIRLVVSFSPGGGVDIIARIIAEQMGHVLGQPIIVDNKPGGEGMIAADYVAKAAPDGSTLLVGTANALIGAPILRGRAAVPYDPFKDFTSISQMGLFTLALLVAPEMPMNTFAEFVAYVRTQPGKLNYGSSNTTTHLAALQLFAQYKLDMLHVPYKGDAAGFADLMANRVHMMIGTLAGSRAFVKDGRMKALMVQRSSRSPGLPDVPTMKEVGANIRISPWSAIFGPGGMPPALVERYSQAYRTAVSSKEVRDRFEQLGFEAVPTAPQEMAAIHRTEYEVFRKAVQEDGIKLE